MRDIKICHRKSGVHAARISKVIPDDCARRGRTTCTQLTAGICVVRASLPRRSSGIRPLWLRRRRASSSSSVLLSPPNNGSVVRDPSVRPSSSPAREEDELLLLLRRRRSVSSGASRQAACECAPAPFSPPPHHRFPFFDSAVDGELGTRPRSARDLA